MMSQRNKIFIGLLREIEDAEEMFVCQQCLGDPMLKMLAAGLQTERVCAACGNPTMNAHTPERIARFIRKDLPKHFMLDDDLYPGYALSLEKVVSEAIHCADESVCKAVAAHLVDLDADEEDFYWVGQEYRRTPSPFESQEHERWYVVGDWDHVAYELTHGQRFFNHKVERFFEELIFEALHAEAADHPDTSPVIKTLPAGTDFYRARLANNGVEAKTIQNNPTVELGAPPKERAANNRMNPAGIPLLYVADDTKTCIAEVRPSIGDAVVVGRFRSTKCLKFFDFTALDGHLSHTPLSLFDPIYEERSQRRLLLEYLHDEIARPVRTNDTDYVVTQALAEFIRYEKEQAFDGIIFRSVQNEGGINYVLFDKKKDPNSMHAPNWRPQFDLEISTDCTSLHTVTAVQYTALPKI
ncbi:MAG: RES family NAD+ phosphorylase [Sulfuricella sp.]|nr:RES family NAD+ phosphorylase [Sulfuricella sp.]